MQNVGYRGASLTGSYKEVRFQASLEYQDAATETNRVGQRIPHNKGHHNEGTFLQSHFVFAAPLTTAGCGHHHTAAATGNGIQVLPLCGLYR